jgi:acyl CoA:acetate/3-ketoacid CoA transferase beta subunit
VITDLGVLAPHPETCELQMVALHPMVTAEQAIAATGWPLTFADPVPNITDALTETELDALRQLQAA